MDSKRVFRQKVSDCINLCNQELINRKKGREGESSIEQIEGTILPELTQLINILDKNELPPIANERYLESFAYAFKIWGWDMQQPTELFIQLNNLNNEYKNI